MSNIEKAVAQNLTEFRARIENRTAKVGIVGLGYVGLPLMLLFSEQKFRITGFDIDAEKVRTLNGGGSYIYRIPATEISAARAAGFSATSDYSLVSTMDAVIISVPTPLNTHPAPHLPHILPTAEALAPHLHANKLIARKR